VVPGTSAVSILSDPGLITELWGRLGAFVFEQAASLRVRSWFTGCVVPGQWLRPVEPAAGP